MEEYQHLANGLNPLNTKKVPIYLSYFDNYVNPSQDVSCSVKITVTDPGADVDVSQGSYTFYDGYGNTPVLLNTLNLVGISYN